jgi:sigma-B regulation protein RsbU (phosphoserine phosphatase)
VEAISSGNLDLPPIPVGTHDEIGRLATGFNRMTEQLRHQFAAIERQTADREKVESELRIARQIQIDLLPRTFPPFPERTEFDLHATNVPARAIGGDFFDFFLVDPDKLVLVIADVSGKGIPAALMMAVTRTIVRNLAIEGLSPLQIVQRTNRRLVADSTTGMFVTMILAEYQPSTGRLIYVNAGHPAAIRYGVDEPSFCCHSSGPLVGIGTADDLGPTEQHQITLEIGEGLIFYTDGVTEARSPESELFGDERLLEVSGLARTGTCEFACDVIVNRVMDYQQHQNADDLTLLLLRRL